MATFAALVAVCGLVGCNEQDNPPTPEPPLRAVYELVPVVDTSVTAASPTWQDASPRSSDPWLPVRPSSAGDAQAVALVQFDGAEFAAHAVGGEVTGLRLRLVNEVAGRDVAPGADYVVRIPTVPWTAGAGWLEPAAGVQSPGWHAGTEVGRVAATDCSVLETREDVAASYCDVDLGMLLEAGTLLDAALRRGLAISLESSDPSHMQRFASSDAHALTGDAHRFPPQLVVDLRLCESGDCAMRDANAPLSTVGRRSTHPLERAYNGRGVGVSRRYLADDSTTSGVDAFSRDGRDRVALVAPASPAGACAGGASGVPGVIDVGRNAGTLSSRGAEGAPCADWTACAGGGADNAALCVACGASGAGGVAGAECALWRVGDTATQAAPLAIGGLLGPAEAGQFSARVLDLATDAGGNVALVVRDRIDGGAPRRQLRLVWLARTESGYVFSAARPLLPTEWDEGGAQPDARVAVDAVTGQTLVLALRGDASEVIAFNASRHAVSRRVVAVGQPNDVAAHAGYVLVAHNGGIHAWDDRLRDTENGPNADPRTPVVALEFDPRDVRASHAFTGVVRPAFAPALAYLWYDPAVGGGANPAYNVSVASVPMLRADRRGSDPVENCTNGTDDDGDDLADCDDPDCPRVLCEEQCTNGVDDDGDGLADCDDAACVAVPACSPDVPESFAAGNCGDGRDNDRDGLFDCDDDGCVGTEACPVEIDCFDGADNDGDGFTDCSDPDCRDQCLAEDCRNDVDDDGDGLVDCADPKCRVTDPGCGDTEVCLDGRDNDGDGATDCADAACVGQPGCFEICDNGRDDDGDGRSDCADTACFEHALCVDGPPDPLVPPDPSAYAPPLTPGYRSPDFAESVDFLAQPPFQHEVEDDALEPHRVAIVRGLVVERSAAGLVPLGGAVVSIEGQPHLGWAATRADGVFDIVVNGGQDLTVRVAKVGYLPLTRRTHVAWHEWRVISDLQIADQDALGPHVPIVLTRRPEPVPLEPVGSTGVRSASVPSTGTAPEIPRALTILMRPGTSLVVERDGVDVTLEDVAMEIVEYTTEDAGLGAMPGDLPPSTAYTYATEIHVSGTAVDERVTVQGPPLVAWLDDFVGLPVGSVMPSGSLDRSRGAWVAEPDGRIVRVCGTDGDVAVVRVTSEPRPATPAELAAHGFTADELRALAVTHAELGAVDCSDAPNRPQFFRVQLAHLSAWDFNLPIAFPRGTQPEFVGDTSLRPLDAPTLYCGSTIECENQVVMEQLDIPGAPLVLTSRSDRNPGYAAGRTVEVPIVDVPAMRRGDLRVVLTVAGEQFFGVAPPSGNVVTITWPGLDGFGRPINGSVPAVLRVGRLHPMYTYPCVEAAPAGATFGTYPIACPGVPAVRPVAPRYLWSESPVTVGTIDPRPLGLGGWLPADLAFLDSANERIVFGGGQAVPFDRAHGGGVRAPTYDSRGQLIKVIGAHPDGSLLGVDLHEIDRRYRVGGHPRDRAPEFTALAITDLPLEIKSPSDGELIVARRPAAGPSLLTRYTVPTASYCRPVSVARACLIDPARFCPTTQVECVTDADCRGGEECARLTSITDVRTDTPPYLLESHVDLAGFAPLADGGVHDFAVGPSGDLWVVGRVGETDFTLATVDGGGIWSRVAGGGTACVPPALEEAASVAVCLPEVRDVEVLGDGTTLVLVGDTASGRSAIVAIGPTARTFPLLGAHRPARIIAGSLDGVLTSRDPAVACPADYCDDVAATSTILVDATAIEVTADGEVFVLERTPRRIRLIGTDGTISLFAGARRYDALTATPSAEVWRAAIPEADPVDIAWASDRLFYIDSPNTVGQIAAGGSGRLGGGLEVPLGDDLAAVFSGGLHRGFRSRLSGEMVQSFEYDGAGRLSRIDRFPTVGTTETTTFVPTGAAVAIQGPWGDVSELFLDSLGHARDLTRPGRGAVAMNTAADSGRLEQFEDEHGRATRFVFDTLGRFIEEQERGEDGVFAARLEIERMPTVTDLVSSTVEFRKSSLSSETVSVMQRFDGLAWSRQRSRTGYSETARHVIGGASLTRMQEGTDAQVSVGRVPIAHPIFGFDRPTYDTRTIFGLTGPLVVDERERVDVCASDVFSAVPDLEACFVSTPATHPTAETELHAIRWRRIVNSREWHVTRERRSAGGYTLTMEPPMCRFLVDCRRTTMQLDAAGRVVAVSASHMPDVSIAYDAHGRVRSTVASAGAVRRATFAEYRAGRLYAAGPASSTTGFLRGPTVEIQRDAARRPRTIGRVEAATSRWDTVTRSLAATVDEALTLDYDAQGRVETLHSWNNLPFGFGYDGAGRRTEYTWPDGAATLGPRASYTADGELDKLTMPPMGALPAVEYTATYNDLRQLDTLRSPASGSAQTPTLDPSYDSEGRLVLSVASDAVTVGQVYHRALPLAEVWRGTPARGEVRARVEVPITADLLPESLTVTAGAAAIAAGDAPEPLNSTSTSFLYDGDLLLSAVRNEAPGLPSYALQRRAASAQLTCARLGTADALSVNYYWTSMGELAGTTLFRDTDADCFQDSAETVLFGYGLQYDEAGRVEAEVEWGNLGVMSRTGLRYDTTTGRLTQGSSHATGAGSWSLDHRYDHDPDGNLIGARGHRYVPGVGPTVATPLLVSTLDVDIDTNNRMRRFGGRTYTYHQNGFVERIVDTDRAQDLTLTYNRFGSLLGVATGAGTVSYTLDAAGRRVGRSFGGAVTKWVYQDAVRPVAQLDAADNVTQRYVYATRLNTPDYIIDLASSPARVLYVVADVRGSVRAVVDMDGNAVQQIEYDPYGNVVRDTNPGFQPFGFAGGMYDPATHLTRFGARDYDPVAGRWLTPDPIDFAGGDVNLYAYVGGDPVNAVDPTGEIPVFVVYLGIAAVGGSVNAGLALVNGERGYVQLGARFLVGAGTSVLATRSPRWALAAGGLATAANISLDSARTRPSGGAYVAEVAFGALLGGACSYLGRAAGALSVQTFSARGVISGAAQLPYASYARLGGFVDMGRAASPNVTTGAFIADAFALPSLINALNQFAQLAE